MSDINPSIHESWKKALREEFQSDYFRKLKDFLVVERSKHTIYPPGPNIFNAFNLTPLPDLKVVILGQDPYHGPGQAHGLCFSVPHGIKAPPSLVNIFKEIHTDLQLPIPTHGNLESWASNGVLLINASLTVRAHEAGSHQKQGWETFTDKVIETVSQEKEHVVFLLWGRFAQAKKPLIDTNKHLVLESVHPSPLSAYNGFYGCRHFSKTNEYLKEHGIEEVDWRV
jgi:uracil-DNA glycosylase